MSGSPDLVALVEEVKARGLEATGVDCGRAELFDVNGRQGASVELPPGLGGAEATTVVRWAQAAAPEFGCQAVLVDEDALFEMVEFFDGRVEPLLETANALDGVAILERRAELFGREEAEPSRPDAPREPCVALPQSHRALWLLAFPAGALWQLVLHVGWEDRGGMSCAEHAAVLRHLESRWHAHLATIGGSTLELLLPEPVAEPERASIAAKERHAYGDSTGGGRELDSPGEIAAATAVDLVWWFWWD